jgi:RNA polymerase sigma factor (sigma-70 family)
VEASALPASVGLARTRISIGASFLRLRSDEQLVSLFRAGNEDAFRVIHDRYRQRLFAYTRQMLAGSPQDAEDALQEIFVRAYGGLRASNRHLALRAWLYRIAHNRCIDELRRPPLPAPEAMECLNAPVEDPATKVEQRDALRRLIGDVQRLPHQQRSALLMRELGGMAYADMAGALGVSLPAVKSLLVRARVGLAQADEARHTACPQIREELILAHDRGVRASGIARRHMRDCSDCREFRAEVRGVSRQFAALVPALGPAAVLAKLLGLGGGAGGGAAAGSSAAAGGSAIASGGAIAAGSAAGTGGAIASASVFATGATHVVTLLAAAVVTAGGAVEIQRTMTPPVRHHAQHRHVVPARPRHVPTASAPTATAGQPQVTQQSAPAAVQPAIAPSPPAPATATATATATVKKVVHVTSTAQPSSVTTLSANPAVPAATTTNPSADPATLAAGTDGATTKDPTTKDSTTDGSSGTDVGAADATLGAASAPTGAATASTSNPTVTGTPSAGATTGSAGSSGSSGAGASTTQTGSVGSTGSSTSSTATSTPVSASVGGATGGSGAGSGSGSSVPGT